MTAEKVLAIRARLADAAIEVQELGNRLAHLGPPYRVVVKAVQAAARGECRDPGCEEPVASSPVRPSRDARVNSLRANTQSAPSEFSRADNTQKPKSNQRQRRRLRHRLRHQESWFAIDQDT